MASIELSLKGPQWQGVTYEAHSTPTTGGFRRLDGLYVSKDGQELRRHPGFAYVAEPGYCEKYTGTWDGANDKFTSTAGTPHADYTLIYGTSANGKGVVYKPSGAPSTIPSGWHRVDNLAGGKSFDVPTTGYSGSGSGDAYVSRLGYIDVSSGYALSFETQIAAIECLGRLAILSDIRGYFTATAANPPVDQPGDTSSPRKHFGMWIAQSPLSFDTPLTPDQFTFFPSVPFEELVGDIRYARWTTPSYTVDSSAAYDLFQPPRKSQLEVYADRIIVAAPGYGCMFNVPLGDHILVNAAAASPIAVPGVLDALGVPKGVHDIATPAATTGASGDYSNNDVVFYRVAYANSKTGEIGLVSELGTYTFPATGEPHLLNVAYLIPRWVLRETECDIAILYVSAANGSSIALSAVKYAQSLNYDITGSNEPRHVITYGPTTDAGLIATASFTTPPRLPQMPMGALWAKNMKGYLFSGGRIGADSSLDLSTSTCYMDDLGLSNLVNGPFQISGKGIPPAYEGSLVARVAQGVFYNQDLLKLDDSDTTAPYRMYWTRDGVSASASGDDNITITLPKGHVQFSPLERPGESPSVNRVIFDRIGGIDVIACGRHGDYLVLCTDRETYVLAWSSDPAGARPVLVSTQFGAISPSMVETDMGLTWLSDRGPVLWDGGSVRWIGSPVASRFDRIPKQGAPASAEEVYLRDGKGFMFHAFGVYDEKERVVNWHLRGDRLGTDFDDASTDSAKTKIGADSILTWTLDGTPNGAWSTWEPPCDLKLVTTTPAQFDDGVTRLASVTARNRLVSSDLTYPVEIAGSVIGWHDDYHDGYREPLSLNIAPPVSSGGSFYADLPSDVYESVDWGYSSTTPYSIRQIGAFVRSLTTNSQGLYDLKWWGTVDAILDGSNLDKLRLVTESGLPSLTTSSWTVANMGIGVIHSKFETLELDLAQLVGKKERPTRLKSVILDADFDRPYNPSEHTVCAWAFIEAWAIPDPKTNASGQWVRMHSEEWGVPLYPNAGVHRVVGGAHLGRKLALRGTIITNARVRIRDIRLELE